MALLLLLSYLVVVCLLKLYLEEHNKKVERRYWEKQYNVKYLKEKTLICQIGKKQNDYSVSLIVYQLIVFGSFKSRLKKKQMR